MSKRKPFQKLPKKSEVRKELDDLMRDFLANGGEINQVARGISAFEHGYSERLGSLNEQKKTHTPLDDVAKAIDERKKKGKTKPKSSNDSKASNTPKKKVIYDDFGEVVRIIWE